MAAPAPEKAEHSFSYPDVGTFYAGSDQNAFQGRKDRYEKIGTAPALPLSYEPLLVH